MARSGDMGWKGRIGRRAASSRVKVPETSKPGERVISRSRRPEGARTVGRKFAKAPEVEFERSQGLQKTVLDIVNKGITPITEQEKRLAKQIREIEERGNIVYLPLE